MANGRDGPQCRFAFDAEGRFDVGDDFGSERPQLHRRADSRDGLDPAAAET